MKIYLVRHAEKIINIGDVSITSIGKNQAFLTGKYLKSIPIDLLFSSSQKRAIETAKIIGRFVKIYPHISKLLDERLSHGEIQGLSYKNYLHLCSKSTINRSFVLPNGKTSIKAGNKLESLIKKYYKSEKNILLVSHSGVIVDFLRNNFKDSLLKKMSPYFSKFYSVKNCSITKIEVKNSIKKLLRLGSIAHLAA
jgi:broad specificity phosphatase PhoE